MIDGLREAKLALRLLRSESYTLSMLLKSSVLYFGTKKLCWGVMNKIKYQHEGRLAACFTVIDHNREINDSIHLNLVHLQLPTRFRKLIEVVITRSCSFSKTGLSFASVN